MLRNIPDVVKNLLILNVLMFIITVFLGKVETTIIGQDPPYYLNTILGLYYPDSPSFKPYQIVTCMFMHGGYVHILFNMYAIVLFGSALENVWGAKRFLAYYLITGLGASALYMAVNAFEVYQIAGTITPSIPVINADETETLPGIYTIPVVGASGALFGILVGFAMLFPNTKLMLLFVPAPIKAKYFVIIYGLIELFMGFGRFQGDNIAHFAHLGGMLFGYIIIKFFFNKNNQHFY